MTLYEILGVSRDANEKVIRKAYHREAMKYHPDKQVRRDDRATEKFMEIVDAFTVLSNNGLRASYDRELVIEEESARVRHGMSQSRKDMIEELTARENEKDRSDPMQVYREDLREALRQMNPKRDARSFEEYERIILAALLPKD